MLEKEFLWRVVGGDPFILHRSGRQSRRSFGVLGLSFLILVVFTFVAFFALFRGIFDSFFQALLGGVILTFILKNIYRLTLLTLEPSTLPVSREKKAPWAYIVRVIVVILIAVFVSKCIETLLFGHLVDPEVQSEMSRYANGKTIELKDTSSYFVMHMILLNQTYPFVNLFTLMMAVFYIAPVILKHRLKKDDEYYSRRREIDKATVLHKYSEFHNFYSEKMQRLYFINEKGKYQYTPRFEDEPFNNIPLKDTRTFRSTKEFIDNF